MSLPGRHIHKVFSATTSWPCPREMLWKLPRSDVKPIFLPSFSTSFGGVNPRRQDEEDRSPWTRPPGTIWRTPPLGPLCTACPSSPLRSTYSQGRGGCVYRIESRCRYFNFFKDIRFSTQYKVPTARVVENLAACSLRILVSAHSTKYL